MNNPMPVVLASFDFVGIPSVDGECFCYDVDAPTFERLTGHPPDEYDRGRHPDTFRFYPSFGRGAQLPVRVRVVVEGIGDAALSS